METELAALAQEVANIHSKIINSDDPAIADSYSEIGHASKRLFTACVEVAYPHAMPSRVYQEWLDSKCQKDISSCVEAVKFLFHHNTL